MPSSFSFDPTGMGPPLGNYPYFIAVLRDAGDGDYEYLPNVLCLGFSARQGDPGSARFRYVLDDTDPESPYPHGFADLIPVDASGDGVVRQGDRLAVFAIDPDGDAEKVFDGFAEAPQVSLSGRGQQASFQARGVAAREWDSPIGGAKLRDGDDPTHGPVVDTDLPVRFNPNDNAKLPKPNATPKEADYEPPGGGDAYPVFLDPSPPKEVQQDEDQEDEDKDEAGDTRRYWTLAMACDYLIGVGNPAKLPDGKPGRKYVDPGDTSALTEMLQSIAPTSDGHPIDLDEPGTFTRSDIVVRDFDASNRPYLDSIRALIWPHGFRFRFDLDGQSSGGSASTKLVFYRDDGLDGDETVDLLLQDGGTLDPGQSNVGSIRAQRESPRFNAVEIETDPALVEAGIILAPGFTIIGADGATPLAMKQFIRSNWLGDFAGIQVQRDLYRVFIFDEMGDGHYDLTASDWSTTPGDSFGAFDDLFSPGSSASAKAYARRYRPGRYPLISKIGGLAPNATGVGGRPIRAQLDVSLDYMGTQPGLWDGTGTWQPVSGGWELLKTRLGIRVTVDNPNAWDIGTPPKQTMDAREGQDVIKRNGILNLVEALSQPTLKHPIFRLTTVIESDQGLDAVAKKRSASPTPFAITSRVDCRDHFRKEVIDKSSPFFKGNTLKPDPKTGQILARDDTKKAKAYAEALRESGERGDWYGSVTIPRFTLAYAIGDRVASIDGIGANLRTNAATQSGESPAYPTIIGIDWDFDGGQTTTLDLAGVMDKPLEPANDREGMVKGKDEYASGIGGYKYATKFESGLGGYQYSTKFEAVSGKYQYSTKSEFE